jgi:hypothetical protein
MGRVAAVLAIGLALCPAIPAAAARAPQFGPDAAGIHPGVRTATAGKTFCTANFVFYDAAGHFYLGQAAHCARVEGSDAASGTASGCTFRSRPLGTPVTFEDSRVRGTLAYSSWLAMQRHDETDPSACQDNDFALVRVPDFARNQVNPTMPLFGGPTGLNQTGTKAGDTVLGYGNSPTRRDVDDAKPKQAVSVGDVDNGWAHLIYAHNPGIPGDSGGPYLDAAGRAVGSLSTLVINPAPASNSLTDLAHALAYAQRWSGIKGLRLAIGTQKFAGASVAAPLANQVMPPGDAARRDQFRPNPR